MTPTREQMLAEIRSKCIEANPEIVELKYGCEIQDNLLNQPDESVQYTYVRKGRDYLYCLRHGDRSEALFQFRSEEIREDNYKIIGRPIQLADVLLAIEIATQGSDDGYWLIDKYGNFLRTDKATKLPSWNLRRTLEDQDDHVVRFVHSLIAREASTAQ